MPDPGTIAFAQSPPSRTRREFLSGITGRTDRGDASWIKIHRRAMACRFEITLDEQDAGGVPAARAVLDDIDRLEDALSVFRSASVISRINREAGTRPVAVDPTIVDLLEHCAALHRQTGGAFDITSTPLSRCWGFLQREGRLPPAAEIDAARSSVGLDRVVVDRAAGTVRTIGQGVELNLGAIGKGYALDRVGGTLRRAGVRHALLSAGQSSLLAIGGRDGGWLIDVVAPSRTTPLARLQLRGAAIGTSGAGEQFVEVDGVRYGHVIDPRTGWPAAGVVSASVVATGAADADALSTAFLVGGVELAGRYCADHPGVMALITPEGSHEPLVFGSHPGARRLPLPAAPARGDIDAPPTRGDEGV